MLRRADLELGTRTGAGTAERDATGTSCMTTAPSASAAPVDEAAAARFAALLREPAPMAADPVLRQTADHVANALDVRISRLLVGNDEATGSAVVRLQIDDPRLPATEIVVHRADGALILELVCTDPGTLDYLSGRAAELARELARSCRMPVRVLAHAGDATLATVVATTTDDAGCSDPSDQPTSPFGLFAGLRLPR